MEQGNSAAAALFDVSVIIWVHCDHIWKCRADGCPKRALTSLHTRRRQRQWRRECVRNIYCQSIYGECINMQRKSASACWRCLLVLLALASTSRCCTPCCSAAAAAAATVSAPVTQPTLAGLWHPIRDTSKICANQAHRQGRVWRCVVRVLLRASVHHVGNSCWLQLTKLRRRPPPPRALLQLCT